MNGICWGWILLGGFLAELAIFVIVIPLSLLIGQQSLLYTAPPASFVAAFAFGLWVARKAQGRRVLHGTFVGVVAILIYIGISLGRPEPIAYVIAHALKVLGGGAGGFVASKQAWRTLFPTHGRRDRARDRAQFKRSGFAVLQHRLAMQAKRVTLRQLLGASRALPRGKFNSGWPNASR